MLYIHYTLPPSSVPDVGGMKEREWNVGDAPPSEQLDDSDIQIHSIIADGKELAHVVSRFTNLVYLYRGDRPCVWRGDMARFIFDNL